MTTLNRPIVITEAEAINQWRLNTILLLVLVSIAFFGGKEIGKQEVEKKLITDLQDGTVDCRVVEYHSSKDRVTVTRLGTLDKGVEKILN